MSTTVRTDVIANGATMTTGAIVGVVTMHDLRLSKLLSKNTGWNVRRITIVSSSRTCHRAGKRSAPTAIKLMDNSGH